MDPPSTQALTDPQTQHFSWNQARGESIYLSSPERDKVPGTKEPKKELLNLLKQTHIQLLRRQAEIVEGENVAHGGAEERRIRQQGSRISKEKMTGVTHGFQGTLQEL